MKSGVRFHVTADFVYRSVLWPLFGLPTLQEEEEGAVSSLSSRLRALVRHLMGPYLGPYIPSKSRFAHRGTLTLVRLFLEKNIALRQERVPTRYRKMSAGPLCNLGEASHCMPP